MASEFDSHRASPNASTLTQMRDPACLHEIKDGIGLYQTFNRFHPSGVIKIRHSRLMPPVVVHLGELVGLIYRSNKGQSRNPRTYIHFLEDPPHLVSNTQGTQLYLVGGSYRVSAQGIEG